VVPSGNRCGVSNADREHGSVPRSSDHSPDHGREAKVRSVALNDATAELHAAIDALTRAFVDGTVLEKAAARDRFQIALATFTAQVDAL